MKLVSFGDGVWPREEARGPGKAERGVEAVLGAPGPGLQAYGRAQAGGAPMGRAWVPAVPRTRGGRVWCQGSCHWSQCCLGRWDLAGVT